MGAFQSMGGNWKKYGIWGGAKIIIPITHINRQWDEPNKCTANHPCMYYVGIHMYIICTYYVIHIHIVYIQGVPEVTETFVS